MQACTLTIRTTVDAQTTKIERNGRMERTEGVRLVYEEEQATVEITVQREGGVLERKGDYSLYLPLQVGKTCKGRMSLGGSEGEISVRTRKIFQTYTDKGVQLIIHYQLLFGRERQEMQLEIDAEEVAR